MPFAVAGSSVSDVCPHHDRILRVVFDSYTSCMMVVNIMHRKLHSERRSCLARCICCALQLFRCFEAASFDHGIPLGLGWQFIRLVLVTG